jgi:hypothetical protein
VFTLKNNSKVDVKWDFLVFIQLFVYYSNL